MSCRECECDRCMDLHPWTDEELERAEQQRQIEHINLVWHELTGHDITQDEYNDVALLSRYASLLRVLINSRWIGLMGIIDRVAELEWDR